MQKIPENIIQNSVHPSRARARDYVVSTKTDDSRGTRKKTAEVGDSSDQALSLFKRVCDSNIIPRILFHSNLPTVLTFRLVSKEFYKFAGSFIGNDCRYKSPLVAKAFFLLKYAQSHPENKKAEEKYKFTRDCMGEIDISISYDDFINKVDDLLKTLKFLSDNHPSITLEIQDSNQLDQYVTLLSNDQLSEEEQFILSKLKGLNLSGLNIDDSNLVNIERLLNLVSSNLAMLQLGNIKVELTFPESLPNLRILQLRDIWECLTLPECLPNLRRFQFRSINRAGLTLPTSSPNLTTLQFGSNDSLCMVFAGSFSNLTTLQFGDITNCRYGLKLPKSLPDLTTLQFANISESNVTFPESLPNLRTLRFGNITNSNVTFPESLPNLQTLQFGDITMSDVTFPESLPHLTTLQFGYITTMTESLCDRLNSLNFTIQNINRPYLPSSLNKLLALDIKNIPKNAILKLINLLVSNELAIAFGFNRVHLCIILILMHLILLLSSFYA